MVNLAVRVDADGEASTRQRVLDEPLEGQAALELVAPLPCEDVLPLACAASSQPTGEKSNPCGAACATGALSPPPPPLFPLSHSHALTHTMRARGAGRGAPAGRGQGLRGVQVDSWMVSRVRSIEASASAIPIDSVNSSVTGYATRFPCGTARGSSAVTRPSDGREGAARARATAVGAVFSTYGVDCVVRLHLCPTPLSHRCFSPVAPPNFAHFPPFFARSLLLGARKPDSANERRKKRRKTGVKWRRTVGWTDHAQTGHADLCVLVQAGQVELHEREGARAGRAAAPPRPVAVAEHCIVRRLALHARTPAAVLSQRRRSRRKQQASSGSGARTRSR
eukprot:COSAG04_NODE_611_length_12005_cov_230.632538_11_plen_337_part_00